MFDLEYLFLKIRSKSVGEELNLTVTCQDDGETKVETTIDLEEVEVKIPDGHSKQIYVSDNISIMMKYPSMEQFIKNNLVVSKPLKRCLILSLTVLIKSSMVMKYTSLLTALRKNSSLSLRSLTSKQFENVQEFFVTMPKLSHTFDVINPNTKERNEFTLEGLAAFSDDDVLQ